MRKPDPRYFSWLVGSVLLLLVSAPAREAATKGGKIYPHSPCGFRPNWPGCKLTQHSTELKPYTPKTYKDYGVVDKMTDKGRTARGMWITPHYLFKLGPERTALAMKRAGLNAVVIDTKSDHGEVMWASKVELSKPQQYVLLKDPQQIVETFHKHGIYVIGRLVAFKDSRLPYVRPDLSARIGPKANRLLSAGANWLDSYSREVQDYIIDLALELKSFGFDEIQLDYIRFPKGLVSRIGTWLHNTDNTPRDVLIASFLERLDRALDLPLSVDVYGLTTLVDGDPRHLGQSLTEMGKHVEAISPMMYANGMDSYFKDNKVTPFVHQLIHCGMWRTRAKLPDIVLRPYLQAYPNNVEHMFGAEFIRDQVQAVQRAGSNGFLFWNPAMRNGVVIRGMHLFGDKNLERFGSDIKEQYTENPPGAFCKRKGHVYTTKQDREEE